MLTVRDIMVPDPVVVAHDASVASALEIMVERGINSVVVCRGGAVEGILTPRDLLGRGNGDWREAKVRDVMTPRPITVAAGDSFARAAELMDDGRVRHLPVTDQGRLVGILSVRDLMHHRAQYLEGLVRQQTAELEEKNRELEARDRVRDYHLTLAGRIQRQILPRPAPVFEPFSLGVAYRPLDHVSGDCYDLAVLSPDRLGILIADASGHGVAAAFVSVMARTIFQAFGRHEKSPSAALRSMNEQLPRLIEEEHFITMCFAVVERKTLRMTYASGGHPPPLWYRHQEGVVEPLEGRGHLLGVLPDPEFEDHTVQLRPRDTVLFYTDGLVECRGARRQAFGAERAASALRACGAAAGPAVADELLAELIGFRGVGPFDDDVTCIALSVDGTATPLRDMGASATSPASA